jgi:hypothetical protein
MSLRNHALMPALLKILRGVPDVDERESGRYDHSSLRYPSDLMEEGWAII